VKYGKNDFYYGGWSSSTLQCGTWLWDDMTLNSPDGSTLQCGMWLWDDIPLNLPKCPPYWNSTSGFNFDHITTVDVSFCTSDQSLKFYPNWTSHGRKMTSCWFSRWRISAILDFSGPIMGSLKSPYMTFYRSSIETIILNCLVFEKIAFWRQMDRPSALSHSCCRERQQEWLNVV